MTDLRRWARPGARRVAAVNTFPFPYAVRRDFPIAHPGLTMAGPGTVEAGARQWFRLAARRPRATLIQPSVLVEEFCRAFSKHDEYARFCDEVFGRPRPHEPESYPALLPATPGPAVALRRTFRLARRDEPDAPGGLPLLFRVDREAGVPGGHAYLAGCGGRMHCRNSTGATCLRHLPTSDGGGSGWSDPGSPNSGSSHDASCGGGCGGGGGD